MLKSSASNLSLRLAALLAVTALAACSDNNLGLPKIFGIEVPQDVLDSPQPVPKAEASEEGDWPLLGAVPSKPKDFPSQSTIEASKSEMVKDRNQAVSLEQNTEAPKPVAKPKKHKRKKPKTAQPNSVQPAPTAPATTQPNNGAQ